MTRLCWILSLGIVLLPAWSLADQQEKKPATKVMKQAKEKEPSPASEKSPAKTVADKKAPAKVQKAPAPKTEKEQPTETGSIENPVQVVDIKMAKSLENREPVDVSDIFEAGSQAYTWVKLKVNEPETSIKLRYSIDDKAIWTSNPLTVKKSSGWRTWLQKSLHKSGSWQVEVLDTEDNSLQSVSFMVK